MPWPGATMPPNNNRFGEDPLLRNPQEGDYRPESGSPAEGYGCQTFPPGGLRAGAREEPRPTALPATGMRGTVQVSGPIQGDTSWDADTIAVIGDVTIEDGVTLRIRPGACVAFQGAYSLTVMGRLLAIGAPEERIVFTGGVAVDRAGGSREGSWTGIRFPRTAATNDSTRLEYCVIEYARAPAGGSFGGALYFDGFSKVAIVDSILRGNVAQFGGAVFCIRQASPRFVGTLITGNSAEVTASAVYSIDSYPTFANCTVVNNHDRNAEPSWPTAAFVNFIAKSRTTGCVVWDNPSSYFLPTQMIEPKAPYTTYDDIQGGLPGEGNIDLDPAFAGDAGHPYRLRADSPCRDAAGNATVGLPDLDPAGSLRVFGTAADIGAYEWIDPSSATEVGATSRFDLSPCPNPSGGEPVLRFTLPAPAHVEIGIYDLAGRLVRTLPGADLASGSHMMIWDGTDASGRSAAAGAYYARLSAGGAVSAVVKITIAR